MICVCGGRMYYRIYVIGIVLEKGLENFGI